MEYSVLTEQDSDVWPLPSESEIRSPIPITTFLFKTASRCNLDCDYCYIYHKADTSWREKPKRMSREVADRALDRVSEHVEEHSLPEITVTVHGGEPLLAGHDLIEYIFKKAQAYSDCKVDLGMQTNGVLVTDETIQLFDSFGATLGISFDGHREANDRHRRYRHGKSSFDEVKATLEQLNASDAGRRVFSGFLSVIDLRNDPVDIYDYLSDFNPRSIGFLLPGATHEDYPPGKEDFTHTPYADWLIRLFNYWFSLRKESPPIQYFEDIISLLLGGSSDSESLGLSPVNLAVIETDGTIEAVDTLKVAYDGAPELGLSVYDSSFDDALRHPAVLSRMQGADSRAEECRRCPLLEVCGGGYIPHRYSEERGFANPSVYCHDLAKLILHIREKVEAELKA